MKTEIFFFDGVEYTINIGKCREENDALIKSSLATDMWFHLANIPSCHVVVTGVSQKIPRQVIKRCACLCIANSKPENKKNIAVSYTSIANLVPTDIVGQVRIMGNCKTIIL